MENQQNHKLPIFEIKDQLIDCLQHDNRCIISATAGSGKSTMVPQFVLDHVVPAGKTVIVLQPRRIATRMLAGYVSQLRNSPVGEEVGYQVRLDSAYGKKTRILFITEGILLNRLLSNDLLNEAGAIVFDEFHERHLESDATLALSMKLQVSHRNDLKLIVMSATLDHIGLKQFMEPCTILEAPGRVYPIDIRYKQPRAHDSIWDWATSQLEQSLPDFNEGSALLFMPGSYEIRKTIEALNKRPLLQQFEICPLHGSLTKQEQEKAVRSGGRKIIVSTNVAETSLTIPDIRLVVDSGLARVARFDSRRGINTLFVENISIASSNQRAGRAGRVAPGICIRLWSEFEHNTREPYSQPEIFRVDLSEFILGFMASGFGSLDSFNWFEKPNDNAIERAVWLLNELGVVDINNNLTSLGREMARLHLHPRYGRMLMRASEIACLPSACVVAAISQTNGLLQTLNNEVDKQERLYTLGNQGSDLLFEFNAWLWAEKRQYNQSECSRMGINAQTARQVRQLAFQLLQKTSRESSRSLTLPSENISIDEAWKVKECIFAGFVDFLAVRHKKTSDVCQMINNRSGKLHKDSIVQDARLMVVTELEETKTPTGIQLSLRKLTEIDESWLDYLPAHVFSKIENCFFDFEKKQLVRSIEKKIHDIALSVEIRSVDDNDLAANIISSEIQQGRISFSQWDEDVEHFVRRANFAARNAPEYGIPIIDSEARDFIIQQAIYKCRSLKDIEKAQIWPAIKSWYNYGHLEAIDRLAPVSINLPKRKHPVKLRYDEKGDAILSETVQALYDCPYPLKLANNKVQIVYEILAPSRRPVQITRDLDYFWKNSYLEVKKELKGRYPKHEWK